ncbi:MAG: hypothetical protein JXQ23_13050 [Clostridia bacterium]|nr:hypothetical protein [Clostridia bacterium]
MRKDMINVKCERQLFIDERFIEKSDQIRRKVNKPVKTGELIISHVNSPHQRVGGYNSVIFDEGIYKLYYGETLYREDGVHSYICYATSTDGIHFSKPVLDLAPEFEDQSNNIILGFGAGGVEQGLGDGGCMVFIDENDSKNKYKLLARHALKRPMGLYSSNDGIHFHYEKETVLDDGRFDQKNQGVIKGFHLDSQNIIFYDDRIKKYVAYVRRNYEIAGQHRTIARGESIDLDQFPMIEDMAVVMRADENDPSVFYDEFNISSQIIDFYTNATIKYPYAEDTYFMFPGVYLKYGEYIREFEGAKPMNAGPIDLTFASSRDGVHWERYERESFVDLGFKDDFDAYSLYMVHGIVPGRDNDLYMYYMGSDIIHGYARGDKHEKRENAILEKAGVESRTNTSAISRLTIRRDGFVSIKGSYKGGYIRTPLLSFTGNKLLLNINTSAAGRAKVGFLDENDYPIAGFSINDCDLIHTTNDINKVVTFNNSSDLSLLENTPVKLYIELAGTELFAFQFSY